MEKGVDASWSVRRNHNARDARETNTNGSYAATTTSLLFDRTSTRHARAPVWQGQGGESVRETAFESCLQETVFNVLEGEEQLGLEHLGR